MTSFGWKRKVPEKKPAAVKAFTPVEQTEEAEDPGFDWVAATKKQRLGALEDAAARSARLKQEGVRLAEEGKFWQAIARWEEALSARPEDARLWEMKAQALVQLHEWEGAVVAAERAVSLEKTWWAAHQTLGRAHLGLGRLEEARRCFQRAVHLHPEDEELRKEDLVS